MTLHSNAQHSVLQCHPRKNGEPVNRMRPQGTQSQTGVRSTLNGEIIPANGMVWKGFVQRQVRYKHVRLADGALSGRVPAQARNNGQFGSQSRA